MRDVYVKNSVGLHAKFAAYFVRKANEYRSSIWVSRGEFKANAKSLLGVLSLGVMGGVLVEISADGVDEEQAVDSLVEFLQSSC